MTQERANYTCQRLEARKAAEAVAEGFRGRGFCVLGIETEKKNSSCVLWLSDHPATTSGVLYRYGFMLKHSAPTVLLAAFMLAMLSQREIVVSHKMTTLPLAVSECSLKIQEYEKVHSLAEETLSCCVDRLSSFVSAALL